ncbi:MAG TPA: ABC transporter substrate-binding protein [Candidatus Acidoferrales bacterium]|nr:ABC transporter substrate-binding protein [Candidatus Acidoferrales bacterium]
MKLRYLWLVAFVLGSWVDVRAAAAPSAALLKAKQEAEARGYVFVTSREEIVERAKKEGKLRVFSSQEPRSIKAMAEAFKKKYPFIDIRAEEIVGLENYQRILQEMKAGLAKTWDVNYVAFDFYNDFLPYQKKFDLLGMAQHGVLQIAPKLVDPLNRHVVAVQSNMQVIAFHKELMPAAKLPDSWEGFLRPEFKGRKFALDIRPKMLAALVPVWGMEKTVDIARKLAAQEPIWFRGEQRLMISMIAGEIGLCLGPNYKSFKLVQEKDARKVLDYKVIEPVPARLTEAEAVLNAAANPYAGLLWLEFQASAEGQKILDEVDLAASILSPGSIHEQLTRGKQVSVLAWEHYPKMGKYEEEIVRAFGFPRAERK